MPLNRIVPLKRLKKHVSAAINAWPASGRRKKSVGFGLAQGSNANKLNACIMISRRWSLISSELWLEGQDFKMSVRWDGKRDTWSLSTVSSMTPSAQRHAQAQRWGWSPLMWLRLPLTFITAERSHCVSMENRLIITLQLPQSKVLPP